MPAFPSFPDTRHCVDAVVIGRNEGERLRACIASLLPQVARVIYVDSGSGDGSVALARGLGAQVLALDMSQPFTAARARNAGLAEVTAEFVQFVDGDCVVDAGWVAAALAAMADHPRAAVICGRRRERFPDASPYNRLCDREWDTPIGPARACGGDALMRVAHLRAVGGFRESLIAGEEPELCLRLRRFGHEIWRIDAEMTLHDAAITRIAQWWQRNRRAGHAFAEGAALHGKAPERHWVTESRRALFWGLAVPLLAVAAGLFHPLGFAVLLLWPVQVVRLLPRMGPEAAFFTVLGKLPEAQGVMGYWFGRLRRSGSGLIEYK
ncbi:glycosyltransferase family 2 protein [Pseudorhodobacter sp.]|uniref:glycosyltransferase family 2 protein n=1 Tax=Pseudorhodobacter sp. TaxID=1934400 RepID=UPI002649FDD1|nr:glycosyltransferase [Pseudorhodobacter sp.]MDN5786794.1 glycosyltransferase [Pseudorhodobacter sp.]